MVIHVPATEAGGKLQRLLGSAGWEVAMSWACFELLAAQEVPLCCLRAAVAFRFH